MDSETIDKIKKNFGEKVEVTESVDTNLIGGITVKTEDKILDGSLKAQLNTLKQKLI